MNFYPMPLRENSNRDIYMTVRNLVEAFNQTVQRCGTRVCFRYVEGGSWQNLNWLEVRERVIKIAGGLKKMGLNPGDRVAIFSKTRFEWTLADLGILASGGVVVPIYESNTAEQAEFVLRDCEAKVVFVENQTQYEKIKKVLPHLNQLKQIISFDALSLKGKTDGIYALDEVMMLGSEMGETVYQNSLQMLTSDMDASFVYTSGTTGNPKGVILTHGNFLAEIEAFVVVFALEPHFETLLFLPLAHIFARVVQYFQISVGFIQCYAESIDKILDNISQVKPHFIASVPRIFEKIHARTLQNAQANSPAKQKIFRWACQVGEERTRLMINKQFIPLTLSLKYKLAHKLVYSKLHQKLGGRLKFFISGGAPLAKELVEFFNAFGLTILEGYGLTETAAAISVNRFDAFKPGTVGIPVPGAEFKIASDGEILTRGKMVFRGYYKNPQATAEAIDAEGWFHTGDIGEFDSEGFLRITDRKKDIIVTAGGKNVAPQNIENLIKTDPYISQIVVHGDRRKFLSALVTLDQLQIEKFAQQHSIPYVKYEDLVNSEKIYNFIRTRIDEKNKQLAKYETIKRFAILPHDFTVESGELTPTLKIKRKVISLRYQSILDRFYQE